MRSEFRCALRTLQRTPGFTIATVVTLALGIAATTAVYSVVDGVLLKPLPFDHPERIVTVAVARQDGHFGLSGGVVEALYRLPAIERAAVFTPRAERTLRDGKDPEQLPGALVSDGFFSVFRTAPLVGRTFADAPAAGVSPLVLSERLWRRRFGSDPSAIGRVVNLEGKPHVIVGVMPRRFAVPEEAEFWAPLAIDAQQRAEVGTGPFDGVARLRRSDIDEASAQAATLSASIETMAGRQQRFVLTQMLETIGRPYRSMLMLLLVASGLVLLVACANAANLSVAQVRNRTQELAVPVRTRRDAIPDRAAARNRSAGDDRDRGGWWTVSRVDIAAVRRHAGAGGSPTRRRDWYRWANRDFHRARQCGIAVRLRRTPRRGCH